MLFSRDWLARYVELPEPPAEVARRLTLAGLAVEGIQEADGDAILDVDVTTNRPDCMNHLGLARELAVLFERELKPPSFALPERLGGPEVEIEVEDEAACPRFVGRVVSGVEIGDSPEWLKRRLAAVGVRSINNVVDVTNFVLWELGQPLHAYDLAKLAGGRIVVRRARTGERLTTLDGALRELDPEILVIADAREPVGLAGVMGGAASEVSAATADVLLEGAHFDRRAVRAAARRFGLHTDASHRFERGADPEICLAAVDRAAALIAQLAGGTVAAVAAGRRARPSPPRRGRLDLARLDAFAGVAIPASEVERILRGLGFGMAPVTPAADGGGPAWEVTVPSWRIYDFEPRPWVPGSNRAAATNIAEVYPQDLYEEVMRVYGYERIPAALPALPGPDGHPSHAAARRRRIRRHLAACGYAEAIHYAFGDRVEALALPSIEPGAVPIELGNPISERASALRRSLVPGLVESARFNRRRGAASVRLFEVATIFLPRREESGGPAELPDQPEMVALVCGGTVGNPWQREIELDLFDAKGAIESLAAALGGRIEARPPADPSELPGLLAGSSAWLHAAGTAGTAGGERPVGYLGRLEAEDGFPLYVAEVAADALEGAVDLAVRLPPRLPGVGADLTLTHSLAVPWAEIERAIDELAPPDLVSWELVVRYRGQGVPEGAVNTTIHFVYNAGDRTLTQDEVNERQAGLAAELARRFGWRGKE